MVDEAVIKDEENLAVQIRGLDMHSQEEDGKGGRKGRWREGASNIQ